MLSKPDFEKKHILYVFSMDGEKVSFRNDNIVITDKDGNVKHQSTCYRIFSLHIIGHITITSGLIQKSRKFGFPIYLMTPSFRIIDTIGFKNEGNFKLRQLQYSGDHTPLAKHILKNKIENQAATLRKQRVNNWDIKERIDRLNGIIDSVEVYDGDTIGLMGLEGTASRIYFGGNFNDFEWTGRKPRVKNDYINSTLDIGYTILFNFVDSMLNLYGFDKYRGVYHREFYKRKSLVCDMVEPFRPLIDWQVRKSIKLKQCKEEDFNLVNGAYLLSIEHNKDYQKFLSKPLMDNRIEIFSYFQSYYRAFMKQKVPSAFPVFGIA